MSFTLQEVVFRVRSNLGEQIPNFWYTKELIISLNSLIQEMCSEAQCLETAVKYNNWPAGEPEQALPIYMENITEVGVFSGQFFQLRASENYSDLQVASRVGGIPQTFYTKTNTTMLSPQGTAANPTNDIVIVPVNQPPIAPDAINVIGLWPFPQAAMPVTVFGVRFHGWVDKPQDPVYIPRRYLETLIAGGTWKGKEKEGMYDEAVYWRDQYREGREDHTRYWINRRQLNSLPSYGGVAWPTLARGSSSVIFLDQNPGLFNQ